METVRTDDEIVKEDGLEWHRPTVMTYAIAEATLGKLGSLFDGPAQPAVFDG